MSAHHNAWIVPAKASRTTSAPPASVARNGGQEQGHSDPGRPSEGQREPGSHTRTGQGGTLRK